MGKVQEGEALQILSNFGNFLSEDYRSILRMNLYANFIRNLDSFSIVLLCVIHRLSVPVALVCIHVSSDIIELHTSKNILL